MNESRFRSWFDRCSDRPSHNTTLLGSSVGLGWSDIDVEVVDHLPPSEPIHHAGIDRHLVFTLISFQPVLMDCWRNGWVTECVMPGRIGVVPACVPGAFRWHAPARLLGAFVSPQAWRGIVVEGFGRDPETVCLQSCLNREDEGLRNLLLLLGAEVDLQGEHGTRYADAVGTALIARLVGMYSTVNAIESPPPPWYQRGRSNRASGASEEDLARNFAIKHVSAPI